MSKKFYGEQDVIAEINLLVKKLGSQKLFAKSISFSAQYVGDVLNGRRSVSEELASKVGFNRQVVYKN